MKLKQMAIYLSATIQITSTWVNTVLTRKIPVRFIYPGTEQSLNGTRYKNTVASQGVDLLTTKLWFDAF
nr:SusD/RagB family nutrient-binding outer membrane lipoprotein [Pedobacter mendelii]